MGQGVPHRVFYGAGGPLVPPIGPGGLHAGGCSFRVGKRSSRSREVTASPDCPLIVPSRPIPWGEIPRGSAATPNSLPALNPRRSGGSRGGVRGRGGRGWPRCHPLPPEATKPPRLESGTRRCHLPPTRQNCEGTVLEGGVGGTGDKATGGVTRLRSARPRAPVTAAGDKVSLWHRRLLPVPPHGARGARGHGCHLSCVLWGWRKVWWLPRVGDKGRAPRDTPGTRRGHTRGAGVSPRSEKEVRR